jgi:hypothetical protein
MSSSVVKTLVEEDPDNLHMVKLKPRPHHTPGAHLLGLLKGSVSSSTEDQKSSEISANNGVGVVQKRGDVNGVSSWKSELAVDVRSTLYMICAIYSYFLLFLLTGYFRYRNCGEVMLFAKSLQQVILIYQLLKPNIGYNCYVLIL